jgi:hypothetical protein
MVNPDAVRKLLGDLPGLRMSDIHHVTSFRCYRRTSDDEMQTLIVEIHDAGPDVTPELRYSCMALTEDGRFATGNPGRSIEEALAIVHWGELDQPAKEGWKYWR